MKFLGLDALSTDPTPPAPGVYLIYQKNDGAVYFEDSGGVIRQLLASGNSGVPTGTVLEFAGATAPAGYLLCYGQAIDRTTYAALFTAIGTLHGTGDGSITFNLPDRRGRTGFGKDDMGGPAASRITNANSGIVGTTIGAAGGDERLYGHTHTINSGTANVTNASGTANVTSPAHGHTIDGGNNAAVANGTVSFGGSGNAANFGQTTGNATVTVTDSGHTHTATDSGHTHTAASTGAGSSQNMPPAIIMNYIIKT